MRLILFGKNFISNKFSGVKSGVKVVLLGGRGDLADGIKFNLTIKRSFVFIDECFTRCIGKGYKRSVLILVSIFKNNDCLCYWRECRSVIFQLITRVVLTRLCTMIFDSSR